MLICEIIMNMLYFFLSFKIYIFLAHCLLNLFSSKIKVMLFRCEFSVNTIAAERLYTLIGEWCKVSEDTTLLDLCCGTGTIGLSLAKVILILFWGFVAEWSKALHDLCCGTGTFGLSLAKVMILIIYYCRVFLWPVNHLITFPKNG